MLRYILKRILIFVPTLIVITLLGFVISINAPGDPVERKVKPQGSENGSASGNKEDEKKLWKEKLGLDLPVFYFSLTSLARPDTLYKIYDKDEKEALDRLISQHGNWPEIEKYYHSVKLLHDSLLGFKPDSNSIRNLSPDVLLETTNQLKFESLALQSSYDPAVIDAKFNAIRQGLTYFPSTTFKSLLETCRENYAAIKTNESKWKNYIPCIAFYGIRNQYHRWLFGDGGKTSRGLLLHGDFGVSYTTWQPISDVIWDRIGWSLFFSMLSVVLAYLVSIPVGVKAAAKRGSRFDRSSSVMLFILYSMPSFWLATLLMMTFGNTDVLAWFPTSGVKPALGYPEGAGLLEKIRISLPYIILPAICYTYSSFAFLSRTMRVSVIEAIGQDYIRTARAKGLPENKVIWKHAFRNALLPIITVFANIFPAAIGGSVIIESIFTIPGMGSESIYAIYNNDYPMIIAVLTITGFLTLLGYLISDILYAIVDPRISYK
ncbi:MAG: ABC transporter permease [Bacteroidia bacterium]